MVKKYLEKAKQGIVTAGLTASTAILNAHITYCKNPPAQSSDAFGKATSAVSATIVKILGLAKVLFPFSLVILIIAILFTHDQKALATELKTALIICVAYVALLIVAGVGGNDTNTFVTTFETIVNGG